MSREKWFGATGGIMARLKARVFRAEKDIVDFSIPCMVSLIHTYSEYKTFKRLILFQNYGKRGSHETIQSTRYR